VHTGQMFIMVKALHILDLHVKSPLRLIQESYGVLRALQDAGDCKNLRYISIIARTYSPEVDYTFISVNEYRLEYKQLPYL
jgi:hypothetical protein